MAFAVDMRLTINDLAMLAKLAHHQAASAIDADTRAALLALAADYDRRAALRGGSIENGRPPERPPS